MMRLLVLRPEPGAAATVARAAAAGLDAVAIPLFEIEPVPWRVPEQARFDALLLTSANAIAASGEGLSALRGLPAYAVGDATAAAARDAGFDIAASGDAGVERLLGSIAPGLRLLHLAGADRMPITDAAQSITVLTVYRAAEVAAPMLDHLGECVALIHSPRAARRLAALVSMREGIAIAAISPAAASAAGDGWRSVDVAQAPTDEALLVLAARLCNNPAQG